MGLITAVRQWVGLGADATAQSAAAAEEAEALNAAGVAAARQGLLDEALVQFRLATEADPACAKAFFNLGGLQLEKGIFPDCERSFRRCLEIDPHYADAHLWLATIAERHANQQGVLHHLRQALAAAPDSVAALQRSAAVHAGIGDAETAWFQLRRARRLAPDNPDLIGFESGLLRKEGRSEEALRLLTPWLTGADTPDPILLAYAEIAGNVGREDDAIAQLRSALDARGQRTPPGFAARAMQHLGRLLEKAGAYDDAFDCFREMNRLRDLEPGARDDPQARRRAVEKALSHWTPALLDRTRSLGCEDTSAIFVVGTPRSGTTLIERILTSHPEVASAGELYAMGDIARGLDRTLPGGYPDGIPELSQDQAAQAVAHYQREQRKFAQGEGARVVDKMPGNVAHLGLIASLFPRAAIIHVRRDPLDACLSMYAQNFRQGHFYTRSLEGLASFYRAYVEQVAHFQELLGPQMLTVCYEDLASDPEPVIRRMLNHAGLEFDARCLRPHETEGFVATASTDQVRAAINTGAIGRWRRFERHLQPLVEALGDLR